MPSSQAHTTVRLTDEDRAIIDKLRKKTGLDSATAIIKMAIRESLAMREQPSAREDQRALMKKLERLAATMPRKGAK